MLMRETRFISESGLELVNLRNADECDPISYLILDEKLIIDDVSDVIYDIHKHETVDVQDEFRGHEKTWLASYYDNVII